MNQSRCEVKKRTLERSVSLLKQSRRSNQDSEGKVTDSLKGEKGPRRSEEERESERLYFDHCISDLFGFVDVLKKSNYVRIVHFS